MTIDPRSLWMFSFVSYPDDVAAAVAVAAQSAVVPLETSSHLAGRAALHMPYCWPKNWPKKTYENWVDKIGWSL